MRAREDKDTRRRVAEALGKLEDVRAVEPLLSALDDEDAEVRREVMHALYILTLDTNYDERVQETCIRLLEDENWVIREWAAMCLGNVGDEKAIEPLRRVLSDEDESVRSQAASALGDIENVRAIEALIHALEDGDVDLRASAASALGGNGDGRAVSPLTRLLDHDVYEVRKSAATARALPQMHLFWFARAQLLLTRITLCKTRLSRAVE